MLLPPSSLVCNLHIFTMRKLFSMVGKDFFFLQCEQIILCSPYCAFKLVRPVYALNNKSLSSEIKMPAGTKAESRRSSWNSLLCALLSSLEFWVHSLGPALAASLVQWACSSLSGCNVLVIEILCHFPNFFFLGNPKVILTELTLFWYLFESKVTHEHAGWKY